MKAFTVEYAYSDQLWTKEYVLERGCELSRRIPVVRLPEVDKLIAEAVWAMELVFEQAPMFSEYTAKEMTDRSQAFLAGQVVTEWRERQKGAS